MTRQPNAIFTWKDQLPLILLLVAIFQIGYSLESRSDIWALWIYLSFAFIGYLFILLRIYKNPFPKLSYYTAIFSRIILLMSFPLLSDDIYRFIWDGAQILHGINPFVYLPIELMAMKLDWVDPNLFEKMNSPEYFSIYPPINQLIFMLSAIPGKGNLLASAVILRLIIIAFDFGNIYYIRKLLLHVNKDERLVFIYALNPLVIIEFTGNLHFEAVMIFFTLLSIYLLLKDKWILASVALGMAICAKLIPLIFLPLFIHHIGWKKSIYASMVVGITVALLFLPFIHTWKLLQNIFSSIQLYYGKFEFNGSIYQLLKAIGWKILGYNPIAITSKILLFLTFSGFIITYIKSKNIISGIYWLMFNYTIFGAIVHPWYILILVAFTPFLKWRFALIWSLMICLSYYTYRIFPYQESLGLLFIEYFVLGAYMIYELICIRKKVDFICSSKRDENISIP